MAIPSVTYTFSNGTAADATQVNTNFTDLINGASDGTKDYTIGSLIVNGVTTLKGNVALGDSSVDDLTVSASLASTIPVKTTNSFDIGGSTLGLRKVYLGANSQTVALAGSASMSATYTFTFPLSGGTDRFGIVTDGSGGTVFTETKGPGSKTNYSLAFSVNASAATITLNDASGSALSATNAIDLVFRSSTLATGTAIARKVIASPSVTIPSTATAGQTNGQAAWLYVYALDNAGTVELAWSGTPFNTEDRQSTTISDTAADTNTTLYSTTARSNVAIRYLGRILQSQATAGTWASTATQIDLDNSDFRPRSFTSISITSGATQAAATVNTDYILSTSLTITIPRTGRYRLGVQGGFWLTDSQATSSWTALRGRFGTSTTPGTNLIGNPFTMGNFAANNASFNTEFASAVYYVSEPIFLASGTAIYLNVQWRQQSGTAGTVGIVSDGSANFPLNLWAEGMDD